eukprot:scpid16950/ scgid26792/ 
MMTNDGYWLRSTYIVVWEVKNFFSDYEYNSDLDSPCTSESVHPPSRALALSYIPRWCAVGRGAELHFGGHRNLRQTRHLSRGSGTCYGLKFYRVDPDLLEIRSGLSLWEVRKEKVQFTKFLFICS